MVAIYRSHGNIPSLPFVLPQYVDIRLCRPVDIIIFNYLNDLVLQLRYIDMRVSIIF